ncbi:CoA transferase [Microbacterium sp.]|uniref:CoA transferase n=1 Tax=Microbacterium sp. TaxID=51671 RepID=UPI00281184DA|nr:CoA transferase [Microbacterium sp.]
MSDSAEDGAVRAGLHEVGRRVAQELRLAPEEPDAVVRPARLPNWRSALPVGALAMDSVALASLAIALSSHDGERARAATRVEVDPVRVQASFGSDRVLRVDGEAPTVWAPLSGFWRVADGWVRTHGNYPHHARRLVALLGLPPDADRDRFQTALRERSRFELEDGAAAGGALVLAVRTPHEWREHPQHPHIDGAPLVLLRDRDGAPPRPMRPRGARPLSGLRVLDLTRVIAGPVATRDLALAGADVLRVDSPRLPEPSWQHFDTGQGKRSTLLDLDVAAERQRLDDLLADADVVVHGYRPGALAKYGLDAGTLHERHPGIIVAQLSAWGTDGPWGRRRGFDSLVQAASGIAMRESRDGGETPGALPVQALDHSAGHFLAAAIATAVRRQRHDGGSYEVQISLAGVAHALLAARDAPDSASDDGAALPTVSVPVAADGAPASGVVECAPPVLAYPDAPADYPQAIHPWGTDRPVWAS